MQRVVFMAILSGLFLITDGPFLQLAFAQGQEARSIERYAVPKLSESDLKIQWQGAISASLREKKDGGVEIATIHPNVTKSQFIRGGENQGRLLQKGEVISHIDSIPIRTVADFFRNLSGHTTSCPVQMENPATGARSQGMLSLRNVQTPKIRAHVPLPNGKLFMLHVIDTNDPTIGSSIRLNADQWDEIVKSQIDPSRLGKFSLIDADQCKVDRVLRELADLPVTQADTIFVYFQGHGAYDPALQDAEQDASAGQFLHFADLDLRRRDLLLALCAKQARLTILLTDCCNTRCKTQFRVGASPRGLQFNTGWTQFEELMLCYSGLVDITSASRGEMAWCSDTLGGWFSTTAIPLFKGNPSSELRSWDKLLSGIIRETESSFHVNKQIARDPVMELVNQSTMIPHIYHFRVERLDPPDPIVRNLK